MVGTGRFELPTPRTPSECSTRLSHVPTTRVTELVYMKRRARCPASSTLFAGGNVFLRQHHAVSKKEPLHLLGQKLLRLRSPRLQSILVQQHLLVLGPVVPRLLGHVVVDLPAKIVVKRRLIQTLQFLLVTRT